MNIVTQMCNCNPYIVCIFLPASAHSILCRGLVINPHVWREQGKVISVGVHVYICGPQKILNWTLAIDSPFKTFAVGLLIEFID